jgi:hypothetical protein
MKNYAIMMAPVNGRAGSGAYSYFFKKRKLEIPGWDKLALLIRRAKPTSKSSRLLKSLAIR